MVSELNRPKNFSKMKSQKSHSRSRRNKLSLSKDQGLKSPKKEHQVRDNEMDNTNRKIKSGSWKRTTCHWDLPSNSKFKPINNINEQAYPSLPVKSHQPRILYSNVLFSGEKLKTPVKIKNLTPRHSVKINSSRSRKRLISVERVPPNNSKDKCTSRINCFKSAEKPINNNIPKSSGDLEKCINNLFKSLSISIPSWNFEDYGQFNDNSEYVCRFDDYNYLVCENVALVGLRLASDGKFKS
ncbi:uncharacterized protein LOC129907770 [Episyrphus balteatus]|uniref:uncharacterized protein LOC129907770 n=1 Tax=Episyrphus balteatus TaxID=286459 RepID=UPI002485D66E|nr:uncharacterized protein LOC129907770 [Episyrphus balteatus]